jgi:hypothetical protein
MRTALCCVAIGLAVVVSGVPAAFAQDSRGSDQGKSAGTGQTRQSPGSNTGISVAVPIGRISVGPKSLDGEPIYVRRMTVRDGMTIVEVSTTPFMPESPGVAQLIVRPDQPASW